MTLSATVSAPPESRSRFSTPRRPIRRRIVQDCSEDEDEELDDPKRRLKTDAVEDFCHSAPSRIHVDLADPNRPSQSHLVNGGGADKASAEPSHASSTAPVSPEKTVSEPLPHVTTPAIPEGAEGLSQIPSTLLSPISSNEVPKTNHNDLNSPQTSASSCIAEPKLAPCSPPVKPDHITSESFLSHAITPAIDTVPNADSLDPPVAPEPPLVKSQTQLASKRLDDREESSIASTLQVVPGTESEGSAVVGPRPKRGRRKRRTPDATSLTLSPKPSTSRRPRQATSSQKRTSISRRRSEPLLQTIQEGVEIGQVASPPAEAKEDETASQEPESLHSEDSESKSDAELPRKTQKRQRRTWTIPKAITPEDAERALSLPVTWESRSVMAYSIPEFVQFLWDLALKESETPETFAQFPSRIVILHNVLDELRLHRFGDDIQKTSFKGIKIRYAATLKAGTTVSEFVGAIRYRLGVSERSRWVYIGIARAAENDNHRERLETVYGRLNLIPIHIKQAEPLPHKCMAFLPVHKKSKAAKREDEIDSSDEEPMSKLARNAYKEWRKDDQMMRWMKVDHEKPPNIKYWWTVTSTSLDCDGFNDEFGVPAALGFDLKRIQMKIAEALHESEGTLNKTCQYGDDDLRQTAYTEEAGNDRWAALEAHDIQFQYPDCNDLGSDAFEDTLPHTLQSLNTDRTDNHSERGGIVDGVNLSPESVVKSEVKEKGRESAESPSAPIEFRIPRKKRKLATGNEVSPSASTCHESSPASARVESERLDVVASQSSNIVETSSPSSGLKSRRLKRSREELECARPTSETTTTNSGLTSSTTPMQSSNAVMSRECQVVARRKNGAIFFMESFRELSLDIIGRSLWWIFAIGHTSITEHLLAYHGPTILWNLRRLRRPWSTVVTEVLEDYRGRAMEDPCLNSSETVERVNDFLLALKRNPEVRHRRLATLKFRGIMSSIANAPAEPPPRPPPPAKKTHKEAEATDDADYNRAICDIVGLRTALFYSKPRFHRMFHETRVTLCKCSRCRNKFKSSVNSGDGRIIRDIESDSTSDTRSVRESPTQGEFGEGDPELVAELKSLAMDKMDDYVTGTRTLSGHSEKTMLALRALLDKCSGEQCEMSQNVRDQLEECINLWLVQKPRVDVPSEKPKRSRRDRAGHLNEGDVEELRRCFFDDEFFPMRSAHRLNWLVRKSLYSMCSDHDWIAPILIARNEKGRAVYAAAVIYKGDFVCEYKGIFYSQYGIARAKEADYTLLGKGSFMFYFCNPLTGTTSCIDATAEDPSFGPARLINHSHRQPNLEATVVVPSDDSSHDRRARLIFFASRDIRIGEELLIDYGETKPETLRQNAWLYD